MSPEDVREDLERRVEAIEAGYEFMLAYAAQGLPSDAGASSGSQIRELPDALRRRADRTRADLSSIVDGEDLPRRRRTTPSSTSSSATPTSAQAAIRMVLAQPAISSQLVDNLNASIHVRALLTDMFLIDEVVKPQS